MNSFSNHFRFDGTDLRLVDAIPMALLVMSVDGRIGFANLTAHELLGEVLVGVPIEDVFLPLDVLKKSIDAPRQENIFTSPRTRLPMEVGFTLSMLGQCSAGSDCYLLIFRDITNANRLRAERDHLLQMATMQEVLPILLHEIKNPLASIHLAVELMVEETEDGPLRTALYSIFHEIRRISLTLEGVGGMNLDLRSIRAQPIDQACLDVFSVLSVTGGNRGIQMESDIRPLPLLYLDSAGFRALTFNLLNNAIQACSRDASIKLSLHLEGGHVVLLVADTGTGMTPEVLARCKETFFTTKSKGTGIGLALCVSLAEKAGGTLSVESTLGVGTRVTVIIPTNQPRRLACQEQKISIGSLDNCSLAPQKSKLAPSSPTMA